MKKVFSYLAAASLVIFATACNNRFVPEDVDGITPYEPLTKSVPLYEQQNRVFGVIDKLVGEIDTAKVIAPIKDIMSIRGLISQGFDFDEEKSKKMAELIAGIYNSFTTGEGDKVTTVYALTQLQGEWKLDQTGLTFTPGKNGIRFNVNDKADLNVRFSNKIKEYHIGKAEVPVKMEVNDYPKSAYVTLPVVATDELPEQYKVITFKDTVVSNIYVKLPTSVELTATLGGKKVDVSFAISLDGSFNGPFIENYIQPERNIKKMLDEVTLDAGLAINLGGYGITIARASYGKGTVKLISAVSKDGKNLATERLTVNGLKIDEDAYSKSAFDAVVVAEQALVGYKKKFDPAMLAMFDFTDASAEIDLLGGVQIKASLKSPKDFIKCVGDLEDADPQPTDSATLAGIRKMFADNFEVGLYFGSDVLQSRLVYAPIVKDSESGDWYFYRLGDGLFAGSDPYGLSHRLYIESAGVVSSEELQKKLNEHWNEHIWGDGCDEYFLETMSVGDFFVNSQSATVWMNMVKLHLQRILPFMWKK